ncbi:unnamed protein product [Brugia pahangi]|uniref:Type II toxin-antitoxin system VapC family toxin n=1 Tax=Brugia pahangi TaxID=6280 RepID=A0A0N4TU20_BRUPA|nr:unnamed protein product [Brugia pahangi]
MTRSDGTVVARRDKVHGLLMVDSEMWLGRELTNYWLVSRGKARVLISTKRTSNR